MGYHGRRPVGVHTDSAIPVLGAGYWEGCTAGITTGLREALLQASIGEQDLTAQHD